MFVSPMLLEKAKDNLPFDDDKWLTELKLDGIRLILSKFNGVTKLYTRHRNEVSNRFKELLTLPLPDNIVLDGELIVTNEKGHPDFELVMSRFRSASSKHQIVFSVFDVLWYEGDKITHLPLVERKAILDKVIPIDSDALVKVQWTIGSATAYFDLVKQHGLEGIVQKRIDSPYSIAKRSHDWYKVIAYSFADNIRIAGFQKDKFGLLLQFDNGAPAGTLEFMTKKDRAKFYQLQKDLVRKETDKFVYLEPSLKCRIKYRNLTSNGYLRIPSFEEWII